ncbi:MAG: YeiH family protein [Luteibaculaceae bacterium]
MEFLQYSRGVLTAILLSLAAFLLSYYFGLNTVLLALGLGIFWGNIFSNSNNLVGTKFIEKHILSVAIILIGAGFNIKNIFLLNWYTVAWISFMVFAVFMLALFIGKLFKFEKSFSMLLGAGSAICGSAAIVACASLVQPRNTETGLSIGVINFLGTLGIFLLPLMGTFWGFSAEQMALITGGTLQSMGHVVAASFSFSVESGELATLVKMIRIALLVPFLLFLAFYTKSKAGVGAKLSLPYFIPGFLVLVAANSFLPNYNDFWKFLANSGNHLIVLAMAAIGLNINIKSLLKLAPKALIAGVLIFIFQLVAYFMFTFFING